MTGFAWARALVPRSGEWAQQLRLASGLVLFAFVLTHFLNHALGIVSIEVMEAVQEVRSGFWRLMPVSVVLYLAFVVHIVMALWKTVRRDTLRMQWWEAVQLAIGLLIPYTLVRHIVSTRGLDLRFNSEAEGQDEAALAFDDDYTFELSVLWPGLAFEFSVVLVLVWVHSTIGLHFWLRDRDWYRRMLPVLGALAVAVPLLALWGWIGAARRLHLSGETTGRLTPEQAEWSSIAINYAVDAFLVVLAGICLVLCTRWVLGKFRRKVLITYPGNRLVRAVPGATLLEISRMNNIPHTSVCGGRARCSTCRVRILSGKESLAMPSEHECAVLSRVGADDGVRLACQIRPSAPISVHPLVPVQAGALEAGARHDAYHWGVEQTVVVMFSDLRGFTSLSERRLSYDVVFLLNRYLSDMSREIEAAGGYVDKYIGDGIMALFGISSGVEAGALEALSAAAAMDRALAALNKDLIDQLDKPLRIGIGIHTGPAILGRIGTAGRNGAQAQLTALGDTVNTASRLESATKELGVSLVVSAETWHAAGLKDEEGLKRQIAVRGREGDLAVFALETPSVLTDKLTALDRSDG
ncbi:MAG: adenylate/guanylate cyclase domain-containing protein [Pseudomonadota bacterium]